MHFWKSNSMYYKIVFNSLLQLVWKKVKKREILTIAQVSHSTSQLHIATAFHFFRENNFPVVVVSSVFSSFTCCDEEVDFAMFKIKFVKSLVKRILELETRCAFTSQSSQFAVVTGFEARKNKSNLFLFLKVCARAPTLQNKISWFHKKFWNIILALDTIFQR